jgi:tripartite-type tricarboxylate transporter receptor subunit TctC
VGWCRSPKKYTRDIVNKLNREINAALAEPKMKPRIAELGATAVMMSPTEADKFVLDEIEKWAPVVKSANIKLE